MPASPDPCTLIPALLAWLPHARRDLPWRRRRDPYAVWISEVMLQQTQVTTVVPYFERWLARFPTVAHLAAASLEEVLAMWEGLGYYARARNLHRAAQMMLARHGGQVPQEHRALLALPGIGRSTAGAILSLAFGQRAPILDGNVRRVLCRLYDIAADPRQPAVKAQLWALATAWVEAAPAEAAGDLNEALMELGALVCRPAGPDCAACPLASGCLAYARGVAQERPLKAPRPRLPHYEVTAGLVRDASGRYLLVRRPNAGLLGGLWGFPGGVAEAGEPLEAALIRNVRQQTGLSVTAGVRLVSLRHAYTHFRITLHAFHCTDVRSEPSEPTSGLPTAWVAPADLAAYPMPVTDRKIARRLTA